MDGWCGGVNNLTGALTASLIIVFNFLLFPEVSIRTTNLEEKVRYRVLAIWWIWCLKDVRRCRVGALFKSPEFPFL